MEFKDAVSARRSEYMLDAADVDVDAVVSVLRSIAGKVPSSFNVQSARMFVLSSEDHERFWGIVEDILAERSKDAERFKATRAKLATFRAAAGTILSSWVSIRDMGLGANIQHYNPIIDSRVADEFGIPSGYRLIAQMVFGRVVTPAGPKDKLSGDDIVIVAHANNNNEKDM